MAKQTINIGASPNDGTGTPLRTAFDYTNQNFTELYTATGPSGNNIVVPGSATITGDLTVDTSTLKVDSANNRVGIVNASPAAALDIVGGKDSTNTIIGAPLSTVGGGSFANYSELLFKNTSGSNSDASIRSYGNVWNAAGSQLAFFTSNNSAVTERYRIDNTGISTWSVGGSTAMTLNSTGLGVGVSPTGYGILALKKDTTSSPPYIVLDNRGTGASDTNTYTQGGILFGAYRDVSNPAYIASITVERKSSAGGASSTGDLIFGTAATPTTGAATERMRIDSAGNPIFQPSATPATLGTNGMLTVNATSNTNLRFSYRGSDGVTRVANITLA